jgi:3-hydroxyisobutyrate dehydrogenase-like beta-hydroxyacid dehydrogenase
LLINYVIDGKPGAVGFIGLGNMGGNMAHNLMKKGYSLVVYDIQSASTSPFEKLGAKVASTPAHLASQVDKVVTMLPASAHVVNAYTGPDGILQYI